MTHYDFPSQKIKIKNEKSKTQNKEKLTRIGKKCTEPIKNYKLNHHHLRLAAS